METICEKIKAIIGESPGGLMFLIRVTGHSRADVQEAILILICRDEIEWYSPGVAFRLKQNPEIAEYKPDPNNEDLVEMTLTVRLPRATADAIRGGLPYRVEPVPRVLIADPDISNKPKRPTVIPRPWSEFADAGMFWFVNRLLHVFGWVICRETEPDGTISGVYPARTRWRGFPEKDETEGFRKVTADIQAHIDDLVEDCQD